MSSTDDKLKALKAVVEHHEATMGRMIAAQFEMLELLVDRCGEEHLSPNLRKFYESGKAALAQHEREQKR